MTQKYRKVGRILLSWTIYT